MAWTRTERKMIKQEALDLIDLSNKLAIDLSEAEVGSEEANNIARQLESVNKAKTETLRTINENSRNWGQILLSFGGVILAAIISVLGTRGTIKWQTKAIMNYEDKAGALNSTAWRDHVKPKI